MVFLKECAECGGAAVDGRMYLLNQAKGIGGHYQQIANRLGTRIPKGVRRAAWNQYGRTLGGLDFGIANLNAESAGKDVPDFVIAMMKV